MELPTPFDGATEDKDERLMIKVRPQEKPNGIGSSGNTPFVRPSTSKVNESDLDEASSSSKVPCNYSYPPPTNHRKCSVPIADVTRPPPSIKSNAGFTSDSAAPLPPKNGGMGRSLGNKVTSMQQAQPSSGQKPLISQTPNQTFGFFNPPLPKPRLPLPFPNQAVRGKHFFPRASYPPK